MLSSPPKRTLPFLGSSESRSLLVPIRPHVRCACTAALRWQSRLSFLFRRTRYRCRLTHARLLQSKPLLAWQRPLSCMTGRSLEFQLLISLSIVEPDQIDWHCIPLKAGTELLLVATIERNSRTASRTSASNFARSSKQSTARSPIVRFLVNDPCRVRKSVV